VSINSNYDNRKTNPLYHITWGVRFFLAGARALIRNPDLLGLSLVPILLTVVLLVALAVAGAWIAGRLLADLIGVDLRMFAQALIFIVALMIGYFLYLPVARVLLAPFAEALSRKTHLINTSEAVRQHNLGWARAMWEGLKLVAFQALVAAAALALSLFFPPVGAPVGVAVAIFLCGLDFLDIPLSTRGLQLRRKLGVIWRHKFLAVGFGAAAYLMLLIPVINMLALPVGVVGATLLIDSLGETEKF
jgi:CysZ protein